METILSVVIPVYNGARYLKKTVKGILRQDYRNFEVIIVDNNSKDNSLDICKELAGKDGRIHVLTCKEQGTSLARKKGILAACGKYIIFSDQDDSYIDEHAFSGMIQDIEKDQSDICQFAYVKSIYGLRKKIIIPQEHIVLPRNVLWEKEIGGIMGVHDSCFNTPVWNKIYRAEVLKDAVKLVQEPLFFAEDENLNILAFSSVKCQLVSCWNHAYYNWNARTGFSSKTENGITLLRDYKVVKLHAIENLKANCHDPKRILWDIHGESLYCMKVVLQSFIGNHKEEKEVLELISECMAMHYIMEAKDYFQTYNNQEEVWEELKFLASDYSREEYYDFLTAEKSPSNKHIRYILGKLFASH